MKIEIKNEKPESFIDAWPGQFDIFSHYEFTSGVPSVLFMITTLKENGEPNACLHAWSAFSGDRGGFFTVLTALMQNTHTYKNILRDKEFCINFLAPNYYENCLKTIENNNEVADEFAIGGFTADAAVTVKPPRIKEAFMTYECTLHSHSDLSGIGMNAMIIGKVEHIVMDEGFTIDNICSDKGFMYNVHCPKNPSTGEGDQSAIAILNVRKNV